MSSLRNTGSGVTTASSMKPRGPCLTGLLAMSDSVRKGSADKTHHESQRGYQDIMFLVQGIPPWEILKLIPLFFGKEKADASINGVSLM